MITFNELLDARIGELQRKYSLYDDTEAYSLAESTRAKIKLLEAVKEDYEKTR